MVVSTDVPSVGPVYRCLDGYAPSPTHRVTHHLARLNVAHPANEETIGTRAISGQELVGTRTICVNRVLDALSIYFL